MWINRLLEHCCGLRAGRPAFACFSPAFFLAFCLPAETAHAGTRRRTQVLLLTSEPVGREHFLVAAAGPTQAAGSSRFRTHTPGASLGEGDVRAATPPLQWAATVITCARPAASSSQCGMHRRADRSRCITWLQRFLPANRGSRRARRKKAWASCMDFVTRWPFGTLSRLPGGPA